MPVFLDKSQVNGAALTEPAWTADSCGITEQAVLLLKGQECLYQTQLVQKVANECKIQVIKSMLDTEREWANVGLIGLWESESSPQQ